LAKSRLRAELPAARYVELENVIERSLVRCAGERLDAGGYQAGDGAAQQGAGGPGGSLALRYRLTQMGLES
jgi:hypothetical protein